MKYACNRMIQYSIKVLTYKTKLTRKTVDYFEFSFVFSFELVILTAVFFALTLLIGNDGR